MFKKVLLVLIVTIIFAIPVIAQEPDIKASSAILAMADGEQIIFDKNPHQKTNPSGFAKLMTALIAYEQCGMDEEITVQDNISDYASPMEQSINLKANEKIKSGSLINAIIIGSANDAATALAIQCGGSVEGFVNMMNERAALLGLNETHFTNPTGVYDKEQYTTASDLLVIYKNICAIPLLRNIIESTNVKINATDKNPQKTIWTSNSLTSKYYSTKYYYTYAKGGKTSSSGLGSLSVISGAVKGNSKFICVVLDSVLDENVNNTFVDAKNLFEYGFNNFTQKTIVNQDSIMREIRVKNAKGTDRTLLFANNTLKCFLLNGDVIENVQSSKAVPNDISAPITKGDIVGNVQYSYQNRYVGAVKLAVGDTLCINPVKFIGNSILCFFSLKYIKLLLGILICATVIYTAVVFIIVTNAQKKRRRRQKKR